MTVTTADSKYSRQTDFGGPLGFVSGCGGRACPFRLKIREREKDFGSVFVSEALTEAGSLDGLLVISKIILDTLTAAVKFAKSGWNPSGCHAPERIAGAPQANSPVGVAGYQASLSPALMNVNASLAAAASALLIERPSARTQPLSQLTSTWKVRRCGGPTASTTEYRGAGRRSA